MSDYNWQHGRSTNGVIVNNAHLRTELSPTLRADQIAALTHLIEEASEVIKAATKTMRFGLTDTDTTVDPPRFYDNHAEMMHEVHDFNRAISIYASSVGTYRLSPEECIRLQEFYMKYAVLPIEFHRYYPSRQKVTAL